MGEILDNANTFFGFQVSAGFLSCRERSLFGAATLTCRRAYLTLLAVINQDSVGRVAGNTKIILTVVVPALRTKPILI